jgi:5'-deoxynucleotidase YfbR-like HD superfamily hydrolase
VAQHCLLVESIASHLNVLTSEQRLMALLHDAPEYVIGDMISPFKTAIGLDYKAFENRLLAAIHLRFGLPAAASRPIAILIKQADTMAAYLEATQLAGFSVAEAEKFFGRPKGLNGAGAEAFRLLAGLAPNAAEAQYLTLFRTLSQ